MVNGNLGQVNVMCLLLEKGNENLSLPENETCKNRQK